MKKILLVVALCLPMAAIPTALEPDFRDALKFEEHWNLYIRRLCGCPDSGPTDAVTCHLGSAVNDAREFKASREWAKKIFRLRD